MFGKKDEPGNKRLGKNKRSYNFMCCQIFKVWGGEEEPAIYSKKRESAYEYLSLPGSYLKERRIWSVLSQDRKHRFCVRGTNEPYDWLRESHT